MQSTITHDNNNSVEDANPAESRREKDFQKLNNIEEKMIESNLEKHSGNQVFETIDWLKAHQKGAHTTTGTPSIETKHYAHIGDVPTFPENLREEVLNDEKSRETALKSPAKIHHELEKLQEMEKKMHENDELKHTGANVYDTIRWLKSKSPRRSNSDRSGKSCSPSRKNSKSFLTSVVEFISGVDTNQTSGAVFTEDAPPQRQNVELPLGWATRATGLKWFEIGFLLLNEPFRVDMMNLRRVIVSGELMNASEENVFGIRKWLVSFHEQLLMANKFKDALLEERSRIKGEVFQVTTLYDRYHKLLEHTLTCDEHDRILFAEKILQTFTELDACLKDEEQALAGVLSQHFDEASEYKAISTVFAEVDAEHPAGIFLAKLLAWMSNALPMVERHQFLELFSVQVQRELSGSWMRQFTGFLHYLADFQVDYHSSVIYSRSSSRVL